MCSYEEETIRRYILDSYLSGDEAVSFRNDQDLLELLNSLQLLRMVIELERLIEIHVENSELTPTNLGTVEKMAVFISDKRRQAAGAGQSIQTGMK